MRVMAASYNPDVEHVYRLLASSIEKYGGSLTLEQCGSPEKLARSIGDTEVLIAWKTPVTWEVMDAAPNLKLIMASGSGYDHIDVEEAKRRSIAVTNSGAYNARDVAQHAVTLVLACVRRLPNVLSSDPTEPWPLGARVPTAHRFENTTVSVIGYGATGSFTAQQLVSLGFEVVVCDPYKGGAQLRKEGVTPAKFDEALERAHVVTLHLRLNESTRDIIDSGAIGMMPRYSSVVNTSRGELVDAQALADALLSGHLACAALDVLPTEPPSHDDKLLHVPNLLITGHSAGVTQEAECAWSDALVAGLSAYRAGRDLPNRVV